RRGLPLVFVSTDYVFSGAAVAPYREFDRIEPVNLYGRSKAYGEAAVREASRAARIVRTSGLYGEGGPDFVASIRRALSAGGPLRVVADQITAPTWVDDLARALWVVGLGDEAGTFHLSAAGELSWCDFAREIARASGEDPERITPITAAESGRAAARPAYSVLSGQRAREIFGLSLPETRDALRAFLVGTGA
ncbi:MAG: sugar nucleotide-binding protein, partial [Candidatus Eisenbacteria bacterium]|nr:sugar nucleotide-binding protein [Candidatus Eisenbacteria bacterium]